MTRLRKPDPTAWRTSPEGTKRYHAARAEAQQRANDTGCDYGLEANDLFRTFSIRMLPKVANRFGHDLRCEVVSSEHESRQQPGHGWRARAS